MIVRSRLAGSVAVVCLVAFIVACVPPTPEPAPPRIVTTSLPDGIAGFDYMWGFEATGGTAPYSWEATGVPEGLVAHPEGVLTGSPLAIGTHTISATVTDARGATASAQLTLSVPEAAPAECAGRTCSVTTPAPDTVQLAADAVTGVERDGDGGIVAVTITGAPPTVDQIVVFAPGEHLPTGLIAAVTAVAAAGDGHRLEVELSTIGDAFTEVMLQAKASEQAAMRSAVVPASMFDCDGEVVLEAGSTRLEQSIKPTVLAASKRPILGAVPWGGLKHFSADVSGDLKLHIDFGISGNASCTASPYIAPITIPTATVGVIQLRLSPSLKLEVNGRARLTATVNIRCWARYSWQEGHGDTFSTCRANNEPLRVNAANGIEATLTATLGASAEWNSIIGIEGQIEGELGATYRTSGSPRGELAAASRWEIGAYMNRFWDDTPLRAVLAEGEILPRTVLQRWGDVPNDLPDPPTSAPTTTTTTTTVPPNDDPNFIHMAPPERYAEGAWAASDGSWLIVERDKADGTSFTYQRVTENGQIAASWTSHLRPGSVVAGANGELYVLGFIDDASTPLEQRKRIVRIGEDGPVAHKALTLTNSSGNNTLAFGEDGNLYFLGHQDGDDWVMRLDPTSLVEQRRLRVQAPVFLDYAALPTPTGLMTLFWGHIPYSAFDSLPTESDWATYTAREIQQGRFSLGTDRSAVFASDGGYCTVTEIARRAPSGQVWRRTVPQLVPDLPSQNHECYFRDVDAMPDGRVVITAELPAERTVVQYWVAADGSSSAAVVVGSAPEGRYVDGTSTATDRNGTAVTKFVRWHGNCSWDCQQHVVSGARDAEHQFTVDLPASPEGVAYWSASSGFLGTPELAIGVGQVLVPLAECSTRRCEGGLTMFISTPADVEPSARPSFTHW